MSDHPRIPPEQADEYTPLNELTDHEYDGIREYDNPVPAWWHWLFVGSFVFAVFYAMYYLTGVPGRTLADQHKAAVARAQAILLADIGELKPDEKTILTYMHNAEWMSYAGSLFAGNCAQCHGALGEGQVGPNMTDDSYINIKTITDIPNVITNGANKGAMPAWGSQFNPTQIVLLSSYIANLRGQNLPGKAPEGNVVPPWPAPPAE